MQPIIYVILAYLIGAIPTGIVLTKLTGADDIRSAGSGNIGATNVYRVAGKKLGVLTLVGDVLKGFLPLFAISSYASLDVAWLAAIATAAFIGHCFPIYLKFKGGKGVATALGVFLFLSPLSVLAGAGLFFALVWKFRYVSLGSISAAAIIPPLVYLEKGSAETLAGAICIGLLIIWRHRENIDRLLKGTENRFKG